MDSFLWAIEFKTTLNNFKYNQITDEKDETPKTGTINYIYLALPITVIATIGIVILKKKEIK